LQGSSTAWERAVSASKGLVQLANLSVMGKPQHTGILSPCGTVFSFWHFSQLYVFPVIVPPHSPLLDFTLPERIIQATG
jgi:hypothetical protein